MAGQGRPYKAAKATAWEKFNGWVKLLSNSKKVFNATKWRDKEKEQEIRAQQGQALRLRRNQLNLGAR
jgi:hypothetical protein